MMKDGILRCIRCAPYQVLAARAKALSSPLFLPAKEAPNSVFVRPRNYLDLVQRNTESMIQANNNTLIGLHIHRCSSLHIRDILIKS